MSIPGNIALGESANQACEVSVMTEGNNPSTDWKKVIARICWKYINR